MATSEFAGQACGIYPRVSSRKQSKKDKTSLDDQIAACEDYAAELGMVVDEACVRRESFTSTVMKRPELNALLADMKARRVPNLIIDRADRLTRAGQLAAATFLQQFTRAGITLHVVMRDLVVRDDKGVKDFLDDAYNAQQENKLRARNVKRAKRSRARSGRYLRGNKAPYGYRWVACAWDDERNVTDKKLVPDERPFADLRYPGAAAFAPDPYAARRKVIELYVGGMSAMRIADALTRAGVPTAAQLHHHGETSGRWWPWVVLNKLVLAPVNEGTLTNFRHEYVLMDADEKHDEDWIKAVPVPPEKQVTVTPEWLAELEPLVDNATARVLRARRDGILPGTGQHTGGYAGRTLAAGRAACAVCGGGLRVRNYVRRGREYLYFRCNTHQLVPTACPGWSLPAWKVDIEAWDAVLSVLGREDYEPGGHLQALAERQAERDAAGAGDGPSLADLRAARDAFIEEVTNLAIEVGRARSQTARDALQRRLDQLEPEIAEADRRIAAAARHEHNREARRALLGDVLRQWQRYAGFVFGLFPYHYPENDALGEAFRCRHGCVAPDDRRVPYPCRVDLGLAARVLGLLGARFTVRKDGDGEAEVGVELTITAAAARPWFDAGGPDMVESTPAPPPDGERPPFAPKESSLP